MTTHEIQIDISVGLQKSTMTMNFTETRANFGDQIRWKSINGIPFAIDFANDSPGLKLYYTSDLRNEVTLTVMHDPKVAGARKYKYTVIDKNKSGQIASNIDPEIIIPPLGTG